MPIIPSALIRVVILDPILGASLEHHPIIRGNLDHPVHRLARKLDVNGSAGSQTRSLPTEFHVSLTVVCIDADVWVSDPHDPEDCRQQERNLFPS